MNSKADISTQTWVSVQFQIRNLLMCECLVLFWLQTFEECVITDVVMVTLPNDRKKKTKKIAAKITSILLWDESERRKNTAVCYVQRMLVTKVKSLKLRCVYRNTEIVEETEKVFNITYHYPLRGKGGFYDLFKYLPYLHTFLCPI